MKNPKFSDLDWAMSEALNQAEIAARNEEVPVGACILGPDGKILSEACNTKEVENNPCGHAEINAIKLAAKKLEGWRLIDCTLVVTLEPCLMCMGAIWQSRLGRVVFGAYDHKGGALTLGYHFHNDCRLNHKFSVMGGLRHYDCAKILSDFFKMKRRGYQYKSLNK